MAPRKLILAASVAAVFATTDASAVYLNPDGHGQALIFPYYTVQAPGGAFYNTFISIRNQTSDAKVAKVRFREGRNAQEVLSFDLYLAPNDMWTAGVIPSLSPGSPAAIITADNSCTDPVPLWTPVDFRNDAYAANGDASGVGLDRTREGYVELIEMGTLTGATAAAITHNAAGVPPNCDAVRGKSQLPGLAPPSGGLSGTVTLLNLYNGLDFGMNAEALADLTKVPMYHPRSEPPLLDFNSPEIEPISHVVANGAYYRSVWSRPVDAVSAVFMRSSWTGEFVIDYGSRSRTDIVMTFPTKRSYVTTAAFAAPFTARFSGYPACSTTLGEKVDVTTFNRETRDVTPRCTGCDFPERPPLPPPPILCAAAEVATIARPDDPGSALGSANKAFGHNVVTTTSSRSIPGFNEDGMVTFAPNPSGVLTSLPTSTRFDFATGAAVSGPHSFKGLPIVGFWLRTYQNASVPCGPGPVCQVFYSSAFPLAYKRSITP